MSYTPVNLDKLPSWIVPIETLAETVAARSIGEHSYWMDDFNAKMDRMHADWQKIEEMRTK